MPPNHKSIEPSGDILQEQESQTKRQEIYYNGYFYDVTDFISRHPGGNIINFYTEPGEDSTQAIEQFHYRSMKRVDAILKSFKKRPAPPNERGLEPQALSRHEALSADFKKLTDELIAEGYFEPSISHVILRLVEGVGLTVFTLGVFFQCETFLAKFLATILVGFGTSRYGWLLHEGGHNSLTGRPKIDKVIQAMFSSFTLGLSPAWWNSQHNRHHAMAQRLHHDVDLATLPFVAFHTRTVTNPSEIYKFFVRFQGVFYWTLDLFVITWAWKFVIHPRYQLHRKLYSEMIIGIPSAYFAICYVGWWYALFAYWFAFFLGINFALSHSHLEVADKPTHWIEYSLTHTANIKSSLFVDYFMGFLNFQIEHHLFPTMPQFRQGQICHRVKALADKHGLPYQTFGYVEACKLAFGNLHRVGKELASKDFSAFKVNG